jgi:hypothetical protein
MVVRDERNQTSEVPPLNEPRLIRILTEAVRDEPQPDPEPGWGLFLTFALLVLVVLLIYWYIGLFL